MSIPSNHDTIAAVATAAGEAAIAIVRLSGPEALAIADQVLVCRGPKPSQRTPRTFMLGHVLDSGEAVSAAVPNRWIDEVIMLIFRAPNSFTRQHVVEFQCHGGIIAARRIYRALLDHGARPALPGEFTRRAFLNGRIDLVKAEAVMDLIQAQTLRAARVAADQLSGSLSDSLNAIYDNIIAVLAEVEVRLDFAEDDFPSAAAVWRPGLSQALQAVESLLSTWDQGRLVRQGAVIVIAGCANVGKSTLMNALLGSERAIVSPFPGTTRDSIEEGLQLNGIHVRLVDTAGYRPTQCSIEKAGIARTDSLLRRADGVLYLIDASLPVQALDIQNLAAIAPTRTLLVANKIDIARCVRRSDYPDVPMVFTSLTAPGEEGVEPIKREIARIFLETSEVTEASVLIGERHRDILQCTRRALQEAEPLLAEGEGGYVSAAVVLREALAALDECLGKTFNNALLDAIFSRFCIGK